MLKFTRLRNYKETLKTQRELEDKNQLLRYINAHAYVSSRAWGSKFSLSMHLHPFYVYASSEGYDESAHMRRLALAFVARRSDK